MTPVEQLTLAADFPQATRDRWRELVAGVLRRSGAADGVEDAEPVEDLLASRTYDGITISPLYTADDHAPDAGFPGLPPFVRGGRADGAVLDGWDIRQRHANPDPGATAEAVLTDLGNGVTSVWLVAGAAGVPVEAIAEALDEVYLDLVAVVLDAGPAFRAAATELWNLYERKGIHPGQVRGNLGADPLGLCARTGAAPDLDGAAELARRAVAGYPRQRGIVVDALPYHEAGGSDAQELGCAMATGVAYLRALTAAGLDIDAAAGQLEFRYAATADQFATIAKSRALRRLWARVTGVCGARGAARSAHQHAVTSPAMMTRRDPWVNMLRTTLACFGAGAGGADAITVLPFDDAIGLPDAFARRIARNTQSILIDESAVAGVVDPAGGSWFVERFTDQLAHAAWAVFTEIERAGGLLAALDSGLVADRLAATNAERTARLSTREDVITGVTEFPDQDEQPLRREPAPPAPSGGLPRIRYAEPFEKA